MSRTYGLPFDWDFAFKIVETTSEIAKAHDVTPAQVAIAWLLAKPHVTSVLIGVSNIAQFEDNLGAVQVNLSADEVELLDKVTEQPLRYPEWFVERNRDAVVRKTLFG